MLPIKFLANSGRDLLISNGKLAGSLVIATDYQGFTQKLLGVQYWWPNWIIG